MVRISGRIELPIAKRVWLAEMVELMVHSVRCLFFAKLQGMISHTVCTSICPLKLLALADIFLRALCKALSLRSSAHCLPDGWSDATVCVNGGGLPLKRHRALFPPLMWQPPSSMPDDTTRFLLSVQISLRAVSIRKSPNRLRWQVMPLLRWLLPVLDRAIPLQFTTPISVPMATEPLLPPSRQTWPQLR